MAYLEQMPALRNPCLAVFGPLATIRSAESGSSGLGNGGIEPVNNADGNIVFSPVFGRLYQVLTHGQQIRRGGQEFGVGQVANVIG